MLDAFLENFRIVPLPNVATLRYLAMYVLIDRGRTSGKCDTPVIEFLD